jgi:hypothetical protein
MVPKECLYRNTSAGDIVKWSKGEGEVFEYLGTFKTPTSDTSD